jgi:putative nucleotidyltransferase with HDIG domain
MPFIVASVLFGVASVVVLALPLLDGGPVDGRAIAGAVMVWMAVSVVVFGSVAVRVARRVDARLGELSSALHDHGAVLERKTLDLSALHESSRIVGSTLELDALLAGALESAIRACGVDVGYIALRDDDGVLAVRAYRGKQGSRDPAGAVGASVAQWVVAHSRPLIIGAGRDGGADHIDVVTGAASAMSVPLLSAEGAIGALTVGSSAGEARFGGDDVRMLGTIANHVTTALATVDAFASLHDAYLSTVRSLAAAVDAKDPYTRGHSDRVAHYAWLAGEKLGLSSEQQQALEMAAYLHDIGKIGIPEGILLKPDKLSEEEMADMRHHPLIGASILEPVSFPWPITPVVRHHHERWDGAGYPTGLAEHRIPLLARVLSVADAYEAMIADRPYRAGRSEAEGLAELRACSGTQFDPEVVSAFAAAINTGASAGPTDSAR